MAALGWQAGTSLVGIERGWRLRAQPGEDISRYWLVDDHKFVLILLLVCIEAKYLNVIGYSRI